MKKKAESQKRTLNPAEAAEYCGFGRAYTYRLLRTGVMPSFRRGPGGRFRIPLASLQVWLNSAGRKKFAA
jgi:excisionase family DNA binding protein